VIKLENFMLKNDLRGVQEMVAHNRSFDYGFMERLYKIAGRDFRGKFSHRGICTMQTAIFLDLAGIITARGYTLDLLCKYFSINIEGREAGVHGALGDAVACGKLLTKLLAVTRREYNHVES
jgi:DNA polymerase III epsilon subunit-like protein